MNEKIEEITPWDNWIIQNEKNHSVISSNYDKLCQLAAHNYMLHKNRSREMRNQDVLTFFCRWWFKKKRFMKKYTSSEAIGHLLAGRDHASILHHIHHRKVSYKYEENTKDIRDFLES
jgi:hypothetical protein